MNTSQPNPKRPNGPGRGFRRALPWLGAAALVVLIIVGLWPRPMPVESARVTLGKLRTTVNEEGKTRIRQRYTLSAPVSGQLRRIPYKVGAELERDAVVAIIDPTKSPLLDARARALAEARRDSAQAQLDRARAAHKFALSELRRNEMLHEQKTVSNQELEQAQWREAAASRDLAAAEAALREAEAQLA